MTVLLAFFILAGTFLANAQTSSHIVYPDQKVVRIWVSSNDQINQVSQIIGDGADIWSHGSNLIIGQNDVRVNSSVSTMLLQSGLRSEVLIPDVASLIDAEREDNLLHAADANWFTSYHRYDEIVAYMESLADTYPSLCTFTPSIGKTIEGRDIPALRITSVPLNNQDDAQRLWFNGGQHAREWVGPATVLFLSTQLLEQYSVNPIVARLMSTTIFDVVPLVNPDGYEYSWTTQRLWRKNRRNNGGGVYGVDLNRNWNAHWGGAGASSVPSSDTYRGKSAASEPEVIALSNYISSLPNIVAGIDFHSYSQLVLRPFSWTGANSPDEEALKILGDGVSFAIEEVYGSYYESIKSYQLYPTSGDATDWLYSQGVWAPYCIELRDTGKYGFVLPPAQIIPTGQEIWNSMLYFWPAVLDAYPYGSA